MSIKTASEVKGLQSAHVMAIGRRFGKSSGSAAALIQSQILHLQEHLRLIKREEMRKTPLGRTLLGEDDE